MSPFRPREEIFTIFCQVQQFGPTQDSQLPGAIRGTSRERIYQELGLEHLSQRRWYRRLCMFWKIVNDLNFPAYLKGYLPRMQFSHNENRSKLFATMQSNTNYFKNSFFPFCVKEWNSLSFEIRNAVSIGAFKHSLLKFIRPTPANTYNINDFDGLKLLSRLRIGLSHLREHNSDIIFRIQLTLYVLVVYKQKVLMSKNFTTIHFNMGLFL